MSPFPLKIGINILCCQADGICSVFIMQLNNLHRIFIPKLPILFHASSGISSALTAFPHVTPLSALYVSSTVMFRVIAWLVSLSSVSTLLFTYASFAPSLLAFIILHQTSPVALLTLRIWHMFCDLFHFLVYNNRVDLTNCLLVLRSPGGFVEVSVSTEVANA